MSRHILTPEDSKAGYRAAKLAIQRRQNTTIENATRGLRKMLGWRPLEEKKISTKNEQKAEQGTLW